jgi:single-strand DNA-binding protein
MIKTQIIAHLGADATVNNVNGKNAINFSACHTERYKDAQGVEHQKNIWVRCTQWSDRTGIVPYLKKGTLIYCEGQPEVGIYQDKQGKWQAEFKLRVSQIQLLGGKKEEGGGNVPQNSGNAGYSQQQQGGNVNDITEPLDDLPF